MSTSGFWFVLLTALLTMGANLLLRSGVDAAGGFAPNDPVAILQGLVKLFLQPRFTIGFFIYFVASVVWFRVIATEPLSIAYPILVSLTFTLVTAGAVIFFQEPVSLRKILGLGTILAGIILVSGAS
jgi:multidrug transporter EmrE-like cation transporter